MILYQPFPNLHDTKRLIQVQVVADTSIQSLYFISSSLNLNLFFCDESCKFRKCLLNRKYKTMKYNQRLLLPNSFATTSQKYKILRGYKPCLFSLYRKMSGLRFFRTDQTSEVDKSLNYMSCFLSDV